MTQSKPVKKKKTKIERDKKNDKKSEIKEPPLPVDKRVEAEINLREMIKQAHKIHKDYTVRCNTNSLAPISRKISRRNNEKNKFSANSFYDEGSLTRESIKKRSKTMKDENNGIKEVIPAKFRSKDLVEVKARRKFSEESHKKQTVAPRRSSDAFAMRKREIMALKRSSEDFPVKENESNKVIATEQAECGMKMEDYHVRTIPFVSLELIDKMKCQDWNVSTYPKENLLQQKRRTEHESSGTNLIKSKKKKGEKKTEIQDNSVNEKIIEKNGSIETEIKRNSHTVKRNPEKCENPDSELIPIPEESPCKKTSDITFKAKSPVSSPKSESSNFDSNLSTFFGAGDPFSSNTSHSYFSSDSDTSKIDKKFMQILKAVTQKSLNIDFDVQLQQKSCNTEESKYGINSDENRFEEFQQSELEQKLIKRINSLERKLGNANNNIENAEKEEQEKVGDSVVVPNITSPVVEQLWIKDSKFQDNYSGVSLALNTNQIRKENLKIMSSSGLRNEVVSDIAKIVRPYDSCKKDDDKQNVDRLEKGVQKLTEETSAPNPEEDDKKSIAKSGNKAEEEVINKDILTREAKPNSDNLSKKRTEIPNTYGKKDTCQNKSVESWSIIKRLEKAFQMLGLNLQDLESSDEQSSAKKKLPLMKKRVSFGKDKKNWHKIEALKKVQNDEKSSNCKKRSKDRENSDVRNCIQYKVESNGSGDKNMDFKKVRSSNKVEDPKGECSTVKNKANKVLYYTSADREFQQNGNEEVTLGLSESLKAIQPKRCSERKMSENRIHSGIKRMIVNNAHTEGMVMDLGGKRNLEYGRRLKNIHVNDLLLGSTKRKSEYCLSASCSLSSMSEEDDFKRHKRKKKSPSYFMESNTSHQDLGKISTSGKGDATARAVLQLLGRSIDWQIRQSRPDQPLKILNLELHTRCSKHNAHEMFHIEERNNELELKQIRERHKQIISEIKTSLNEIKKQHNLVSQLQTQTKKFHKDCHIKRKCIAAYLKDVEQTYENRKAREPFCESNFRYRRALSTDNYFNRIRKSKLRNKTSDYDLEIKSRKKDEMGRLKKKLGGNSLLRNSRCESVLSISATMDETSSDEISSIMMENTSADFSSTDTAESFRTVATSIKPLPHKARYIAERRKIPQTLSLEWNTMKEKPAWLDESTKQIPHYFVKLVEELNRIILTENNKLDDLIVKASGSSNNSSYSGKTKASASSNSSGSNTTKQQNNRTEEASRATSTGHKTSSSNYSGKGGSKQHKSKVKGIKKFGRDKPVDVDRDISLTRSITFIQADPGGSSIDSITDREQEIVISESFPNQIQTDIDSLCPASCSHFDRQEEEFRYRKGDPSFQFQGQLLKYLDEHSRQCRRKTPEEERAYRRKMELERILRSDEKTVKRPIFLNRDSEGHALDFDSYNCGKEKHSGYVRYRQQSIIIDHNRGEENEESQTVLGHASRHSGVGRNRKAPHEYLKVDMKSESSYRTGKKSGKLNQFEEVPVNYFEISLNNSGSSADVSKDVDCQTDNAHDYEDIGDIYLWDESGSTHSIN